MRGDLWVIEARGRGMFSKKLLTVCLGLFFVGLIFWVFFAFGMVKQGHSFEELKKYIRQSYNITSCDQYMPNSSIKGLYDPKLLWETNIDPYASSGEYSLDKDTVFLLAGCKNIVWLPILEDFVKPDIRDYIFQENAPIKIFSAPTAQSEDPCDYSNDPIAYINNPGVEKNAYILALHCSGVRNKGVNRNAYLMGFLLGYTERDIEYSYFFDLPAGWPSPDGVLFVISILKNSFRTFSRDNSEAFVISSCDAGRLKEELDRTKQAMRDYPSADLEVLIKELEDVCDKTQSNPDDHRPVLQGLLDKLSSLREKFDYYYKNEWPKTEVYKTFLDDKAEAQAFIEENTKKTVEELKKEIEEIRGHAIQDLRPSLRERFGVQQVE